MLKSIFRPAGKQITVKQDYLILVVIGSADCGLGIHLHVFETLMHEVIVEVLFVELFKRSLRRSSRVASIPAVQRIESHNHVY